MQEKKLLSGIEALTASGAGVCAFVLMMSKDIKTAIFMSGAVFVLFVIVSIVLAIASKWLRKAELAVLAIGTASIAARILYVFSSREISEISCVVMIICFLYVIGLGSDNYNKEISIRWSVGAAIGFSIVMLLIGVIRMLLPPIPGYAFIASALVVASAKQVFMIKK